MSSTGLRSKAFRRTRWVGAGGLVALLATAVMPTPGLGAQTADFEPGQGQAIAQTWKVDPKAAGLSIGITFGQSLAGHQNKVSRAVSQSINLGVIGGTMAAPGCDGGDPTFPREDQPQPLEIDSRDENAAQGKTVDEYGGYRKSAKATDIPLAEAVTTTAPFGIAAVLSVGGGVSRTVSGIVNGARVASGTVDISEINLATVVKLSDVRWEATYRSTGENGVVGRFTIGSATIGGTPVPTSDPSATIGQANLALAPFGLRLVEPKSYASGGVLFIDPLAIAVVPNANRDTVARNVIGGIQPIREPLFEEILARECDFADVITVMDIAVGSITGAGEFSLQLGGAQATSGVIPKNAFSLTGGEYELAGGAFDFNNLGGGGTFTPSAPVGAGPSFSGTAPKITTRTRPAVPAAGGTRGQVVNAQPASATFKGSRGGALAGVGLATLLLLALVAEGDRRKMRRAQREVPVTEE